MVGFENLMEVDEIHGAWMVVLYLKLFQCSYLHGLLAKQYWILKQLDVNNAFINGELEEDVHTYQVKKFEDKRTPDFVCKLNKGIDGLKKDPRAWFHKLSSSLLELGFYNSKADTSMFVQHKEHIVTILLVYVDYIILTGSDTEYL